MRTLRTVILACAALATVCAVGIGCGGDDAATPAPGQDAGRGTDGSSSGNDGSSSTDGGTTPDDGGNEQDGSTPKADGGPGVDANVPPGDAGDAGDAGHDAADAGPRDFAAYVVDLITTKTNETTQPTTDLCEGCGDKQNKADFASLFP